MSLHDYANIDGEGLVLIVGPLGYMTQFPICKFNNLEHWSVSFVTYLGIIYVVFGSMEYQGQKKFNEIVPKKN